MCFAYVADKTRMRAATMVPQVLSQRDQAFPHVCSFDPLCLQILMTIIGLFVAAYAPSRGARYFGEFATC